MTATVKAAVLTRLTWLGTELDVKNAFNSVSRFVVAEEFRTAGGVLHNVLPFFPRFLGLPRYFSG